MNEADWADLPGRLVVLSGPSGSGKSTLVRRLLALPGLRLKVSVSATTRSPRPGEEPGRDYVFLSKEQFERMRRRAARIGPGSWQRLRHAARAGARGHGRRVLRAAGDRCPGRSSGAEEGSRRPAGLCQASQSVDSGGPPAARGTDDDATIKRRLSRRVASSSLRRLMMSM